MMAAIAISGLVKTYGKQNAVDNLTANIAKGRITGFLGPNGAGKSTTLRCLVGLSAPTSGTALIYDKPYRDSR
jgi:ABC-2 type transport system ATP-binding protein